MKLKKLHLNELSAKQKEIYNFHLVAAKLAQYGYHLIKLDYSYWKADFLACSEEHNIKVIMKTAPTIDKSCEDEDLHIVFPLKNIWFFMPYKDLLEIASNSTSWTETSSWKDFGVYSTTKISNDFLQKIIDYRL